MNGQSTHYRRETLIRYAPLFLWVCLIFFFSSPEASSEQTSRIIGPLLHFFVPNIFPETEAVIHGFVRKCAHFTEYAVLAFLAVRTFSSVSYGLLRKKRFLWALLLVALTASLDEFNQSFEVSRTGSVWDVLLDIFGGSATIITLLLFHRRHGFSVAQGRS